MKRCTALKELNTTKNNIINAAQSLLNIAHDYYVIAESNHNPWFKVEARQTLRDALECMKRHGLIKNYSIPSNKLNF